MLRTFSPSSNPAVNFQDTQYIDFTNDSGNVSAVLNLENGLFNIGQVHLPPDLLYLDTSGTQEIVHILNTLQAGVDNDASDHEQEALVVRHLHDGQNIALTPFTLDNSVNWGLAVVFRYRSFTEAWSRIFDFVDSATHSNGMVASHQGTTQDLVYANNSGSTTANIYIISSITLNTDEYSLLIITYDGSQFEFMHRQGNATDVRTLSPQPVNITGEFNWLGKSGYGDPDPNIDIPYFGLFKGQNAPQIAKALGHWAWRQVK